MWTGQMLAMMGFASVIPFTPLYIQELGVTDPDAVKLWAGALSGTTSLFLAISAPFWGILSDRLGRKGMVLRAFIAGAIVVWGMAFAQDVYQFLACRILQGIFTGTQTASMTLTSSVVPRHKMGHSLGMIQMAVYTGSSLGPLVGGVLADLIGYRCTFLIMGGVLVLGSVITTVFVKEEPYAELQETAGAAGEQEQPAPRGMNGIRVLLASEVLLAMTSVLFAAQFVRGFTSPILPLYVQELAGPYEPVASVAGVVLAITGLTGAAASIVAGRLGDRFGYRAVLIFCSVGAALVHFPQAFVTNNVQLTVLRGLTGFVQGGSLSTAYAAVAANVPSARRGAIFGLTNGMSSVGQAFGPVAGGALAAAFGLQLPFIICGVLMGLVTLWVVRVVRRPDEELLAS